MSLSAILQRTDMNVDNALMSLLQLSVNFLNMFFAIAFFSYCTPSCLNFRFSSIALPMY